MRECGDCTACCEGWVHDKGLDMYAGKPCKHCESAGCAIYEDRPEVPCRKFRCVWLDNLAEFPEDMRPDVSGAIILGGRHWKEWDVLRAAPVGAEIPPQTLERLRVYAQAKGVPLVFYENETKDGSFTRNTKISAYGSEEFAEAVRNNVLPSDLMTFLPKTIST